MDDRTILAQVTPNFPSFTIFTKSMASQDEVATKLGLSRVCLPILAAAGMAGAPAGLAVTVRTQSDAARFFNVSRRTVAQWLADGCPGSARDGYPLMQMLAWRRERDDDFAFQPGGGELPDHKPTGDLVRAVAHAQLIQISGALERIRKLLGDELTDAVEQELLPCWIAPEELEIVIRQLSFLI